MKKINIMRKPQIVVIAGILLLESVFSQCIFAQQSGKSSVSENIIERQEEENKLQDSESVKETEPYTLQGENQGEYEENTQLDNEEEYEEYMQQDNEEGEFGDLSDVPDLFLEIDENSSAEQIAYCMNRSTDESVAQWVQSLSKEEIDHYMSLETPLSQTIDYYGPEEPESDLYFGKHFDTGLEYYSSIVINRKFRASFSAQSGYYNIKWEGLNEGFSTIKVSGIDTQQDTTKRQNNLKWTVGNSRNELKIVDGYKYTWQVYYNSSKDIAMEKATQVAAGGSVTYNNMICVISFVKPKGYTFLQTASDGFGSYFSAYEGKDVIVNLKNGIGYIKDGGVLINKRSSDSQEEITGTIISRADKNMGIGTGSGVFTWAVQPSTYTVTYDDGSITTECTYDKTYIHPNPVNIKTYTAYYSDGISSNRLERSFIGWQNNKESSKATYKAAKGDKYANLTAQDKGTINLFSNFGSAKGKAAVCPAAKSGYSFTGWKCEKDNKIYLPGEEIVLNEDTYFQAMWEANTYTIKYDTGKIQSARCDETITLEEAPQKEGYLFEGWKINGAVYQASEKVKNLAMEGFVEATAIYKPVSYNITFSGNGATKGTTAGLLNCEFDKEYILNTNGFSRDFIITYDWAGGDILKTDDTLHSTFIGWTKDKDSQIVEYQEEATVKNISAKADENVVLYALWEDEKLILPNAVKKGYTFLGWKENEKDDLMLNGESFNPKENCELHANWRANQYYVQYFDPCVNENMLTDETKKRYTQSMYYDHAQKLMTPDCSDKVSNKEFCGWQAEDGTWYSNGQVVKNLADKDGEVVKLTAVYKEKGITIFDSEDMQSEIVNQLEEGSGVTVADGGISYIIVKNSDGTLTISLKGIGQQKDIVIPKEISFAGKVYPVTQVADYAFKGDEKIEKVTIPSNITQIGTSAFEGCGNLKEVKLNEGLISIKDRAFFGCGSLSAVKTPTSLQTIGNSAFENCTNMSSLVLNNGLYIIGDRAFYNCKKIAKIALPNTVREIGKYAFAKCEKAKSIKLSKKLATLKVGAFMNCKSAKAVSIPGQLKTIPKKAFKNCLKLKSVKTISGTVYIKESAFENCVALSKFTMGAGISEIGKKAFYKCKKLSSITLGSKVIKISNKAFYGCSKLKKVTIKSKILVTVEKDAFKKCKKGIQFSVPKSKMTEYAKLLKGKYN